MSYKYTSKKSAQVKIDAIYKNLGHSPIFLVTIPQNIFGLHIIKFLAQNLRKS